jgi:hypothetical protein
MHTVTCTSVQAAGPHARLPHGQQDVLVAQRTGGPRTQGGARACGSASQNGRYGFRSSTARAPRCDSVG